MPVSRNSGRKPRKKGEIIKSLDKFLQEIDEGDWAVISDASTVADWSARLDLDQTTIQRLFRRETGMTFGQWRQQARLLLALERIAVGEKIINVALELGYDSPSAFTSMFKKQFGKTPSHFFK
ncbi:MULTISPECIES: AraC family transcriptional regulator [Pseudomonas]|uniref:helix-turn-helix domain-containing protein n=1 Tax=Pseudomonas sp. TaxID=306 RepID=UPI000812179F|nr:MULTISPECIES: AraC family transcriptional regulator [Pseudomonas]MDO4236023.1 AraC family transcriptional regulator [Pseudomonas sp.]RZI23996.1 AraC family transcriptional regulator [Pseudomonas orientalis]CRM17694.1 Regulatory protein SoxS [Pseudomonas sp. 28 E 9]